MADQILNVSFKIDTGSVEGDAAAAGALAAKAFQQGFGALDLKTPMAKAAEAAQKHAAAIGEALQGAAVAPAHAAPSEAGAGSPQLEKPKPEPKPGEKPEFSRIDKAVQSIGLLRLAFQGIVNSSRPARL